MKDHLAEHLLERISDTQEAITKYSNSADFYETFVIEFKDSDLDVADFYRYLIQDHNAKVERFKTSLMELQHRLKKRQGAVS